MGPVESEQLQSGTTAAKSNRSCTSPLPPAYHRYRVALTVTPSRQLCRLSGCTSGPESFFFFSFFPFFSGFRFRLSICICCKRCGKSELGDIISFHPPPIRTGSKERKINVARDQDASLGRKWETNKQTKRIQ